MPNIRTTKLYSRAIEMLRRVEFQDRAFLEQLVSSDVEQKNSYRFLLKDFSKKYNTNNDGEELLDCYKVIIYSSVEYISRYPAPPSAKQGLYRRMFALCEAIGEQFHIANYESFLKELPVPVDRDLTIGIIKELHERDGVTKSDLASVFEVTPRTAQTMIHRLNGDQSNNPLRIGGQIVRIPIEHHKENGRSDDRRFYTPNSMSPIVFQLNLMQAATLLQSFHSNYEKGNMIPLDMAIDTWCQLSEYVKERIKEIFCSRDPEFAEFIEMVEDGATSDTYRFMTESEMMVYGDSCADEQLTLAWKGGMICDLILSAPQRSWKRRRIHYDFDRQLYYAVPADESNGERAYFSKSEFVRLSESL